MICKWKDVNGIVQECSNSSALAMELLQSCTEPSIWNQLVKTWSELPKKFSQHCDFKVWCISSFGIAMHYAVSLNVVQHFNEYQTASRDYLLMTLSSHWARSNYYTKCPSFMFVSVCQYGTDYGCQPCQQEPPLRLIWIPAWISDYTHFKVWNEITYPFPNFNSCTIEVWEWISNFIPHFAGHMITDPCWDYVCKRSHWEQLESLKELNNWSPCFLVNQMSTRKCTVRGLILHKMTNSILQ